MNVSQTSHPDSCHHLDGLFVLSQRASVRVLLEERRVVVDVQHIDTDPPRRLLPAAVPRQHGQRETTHQLIIQTVPQNDPTCLFIQ